jgi:hypothetical protein
VPPSTSSEEEIVKLEKKVYDVILLSLSCSFETSHHEKEMPLSKKSLIDRLYMKQLLYTFKIEEDIF